MGVYDTIFWICEKCGKDMEEQTKDGPCMLGYWNLKDAPNSMLAALDGYVMTCQWCGHDHDIEVRIEVWVNDEPLF